MRVLKGILKDSLVYYERLLREIEQRIKRLPKGSVKRRKIRGHWYYYLQKREGSRVIHKYLGRKRPIDLLIRIKERQQLIQERKKVKEALRLLPKRKLSK